MRLDVFLPRSFIYRLRRLLHPSSTAAFWSILLGAIAAFLLDARFESGAHRGLQVLFLVAGVVFAWLCIANPGGSARPVMQAFLFLILVASFVQHWWHVRYLDTPVFGVFLVTLASILYGARDAFLLIGVTALLAFASPPPRAETSAAFLTRTAVDFSLMIAAVLIAARATGGQRRKIAALREELMRARNSPLATPGENVAEPDPARVRKAAVAEAEVESLDASFRAILERIKVYFRAHSVLLYQQQGTRALTLRYWTSDAQVEPAVPVNLEASLLGRIFARGISCNWNFDDPNCLATLRDIPYYSEWQPVRNLAGSPLKVGNQTIGTLVVDRIAPTPFTELDVVHLETFGIQLVEIIEMGKRYLEQVDRNREYRLFYRATSRLGQSLATEEIVAALAAASQDVVLSTHILVALSDQSGLSYEIGLAVGAEKLKGLKVKSHGRTWISWLLNSDTGPLMLKDVRSHASSLPVASPREGDLGVRSLLLIPLVAKGKKMGALVLGAMRPDYYQNWHMRILTEICSQAAANIENSLLHRRVESEALSDGLTQVFNHRYFQERLSTEFSRARRTNETLSLLMADIDNFKQVNDTYGHRIGDIILQQIAGILRRSVRSEDVVARYGGEEFVIILIGSDRKGALKMAERIRAAVESVSFLAEDYAILLTISIGTATYPDDGREPWQLIEHADRALYRAKEEGRNRVVVYDAGDEARTRSGGLKA